MDRVRQLTRSLFVVDNASVIVMAGLVGLLTILLMIRAFTDDDPPVTINADDMGETFELTEGQRLVVELVSNPTTGYRWEAIGGQPVLEQLGEPRSKPDSDRVGAGGVEELQFRAMQVGETTLELVYHRPWEEDVEPLERFTVHIVVK